MTRSLITVDGVQCFLDLVSLGRSADEWYKFAERTEDGVLHSELIGIYYNYQLKFTTPVSQKAEHDKLWNLINQGKTSYKVILPDEAGNYEFECYFSQKKDVLRFVRSERNYFSDLSFNAIQIRPSVLPKGTVVVTTG